MLMKLVGEVNYVTVHGIKFRRLDKSRNLYLLKRFLDKMINVLHSSTNIIWLIMNEFMDQKILKEEKVIFEKLITNAIEEEYDYGFYYIVLNDVLPNMIASEFFKKLLKSNEQYQIQRWHIKIEVENELLSGLDNLRKDLEGSTDSKILNIMRDINQLVYRSLNSKIAWQHVYRKIQELLKYLFSTNYKQIVLKYVAVEQQNSSVDFVIGKLKFIPSWEEMMRIETMFLSNSITDVNVAIAVLLWLKGCWNEDQFPLSNDYIDFELFYLTIYQDCQEIKKLKLDRRKYTNSLMFFNKKKIISCLKSIVNSIFDQKKDQINMITISKKDKINVSVGAVKNRECLLLEITSLKIGIPEIYIIHEFKSGGDSQIFKLTHHVFTHEIDSDLNILDICKRYGLRYSWSEFFSKINFQVFKDIFFKKGSKINCKILKHLETTAKELSGPELELIEKLLPNLTKVKNYRI